MRRSTSVVAAVILTIGSLSSCSQKSPDKCYINATNLGDTMQGVNPRTHAPETLHSVKLAVTFTATNATVISTTYYIRDVTDEIDLGNIPTRGHGSTKTYLPSGTSTVAAQLTLSDKTSLHCDSLTFKFPSK